MGKAGAWLLMAVVALWAASPAFACFVPAAQHACCRHMATECSASQMGAGSSCCQARSTETDAPAIGSAASEQLVHPVATIVPGMAAVVPVELHGMLQQATEAPPSGPPPGGTVLRI